MIAETGELPKSLQQMIAECRDVVANWDPNEDEDDPIMKFMREWTLRLSRGEFEDRLYWDCLAEDYEEASDWDGALSAYEKILSLPDITSVELANAHSAIAAIRSLQGDNEAALRSYHFG
jgi:tetratricopeptide (TPR) repeat protein